MTKNKTMNKYTILLVIGLFLNSVAIMLNRLVVEIPDYVIIPIHLVAIVLMICSVYLSSKKRELG